MDIDKSVDISVTQCCYKQPFTFTENLYHIITHNDSLYPETVYRKSEHKMRL